MLKDDIAYLLKFSPKEACIDDLINGRLYMNAAGYYHGLLGEQGDPLEASMAPGVCLYGYTCLPIYCMNTVREPDIAAKTIHSGPIDAFYDFKLGTLEYRSMRFETETLDEADHQGVAVVNYTEREAPYTRIIEHKHFEFGTQDRTVITREYPADWKPGDEPYYPINDARNEALYKQYEELAAQEGDVVFAGRLGGYKYYDMDKAIAAAFELVRNELGVEPTEA